MKIILENWQRFTESHTKEHEEELKTIVGELENASKMHASQAERIQQILDETDDDKLEEGEKKNCGCGNDPCITYGIQEEKELEEDCQDGYERVPGSKEFAPGSCREKTDESLDLEAIIKEELEAVLAEKKKKKRKNKKKKGGKKDACYHKVKSRYDVWPSAYASGALVKCRKVGAKNWGNKSKKKNESLDIFGDITMEEDLAIFINEEGLKDWFDDADGDGQGGWEQVGGKYDGKPCAKQPGQKTKPKCVSPEKAATMSKDEKENAAKRKRSKDPNPNRKGKAKNVNTDPKNESFEITKESLDIEIIIREELDAVLAEKKKKPCKPSKGKRFAKRVNGKCRSFGQKGQAKGGGDRIRPGTKKGDAYCARSAKIKKCKNPPCANALSRKKWKCRGSKSMKE
jgi:hypothetical protein